jgi:AAA15 family ATPase/GTPase
MLVQFTVGNFLSFYQKRTLNLLAKGISELKDNIASFKAEKILRSIVVYGANSSGKSNLIKAFARMREVVLDSVTLNNVDELDFSPFLLSTESEDQPTFFEIVFWQDSTRYRFGFEYNLKQIVNEWLFAGKNEKNEKPLFIRTIEGIGVTEKFKEGEGLESKTNSNRLFISLVAQLGGSISNQIIKFISFCNVLTDLDDERISAYTTRMIDTNQDLYDNCLKLFQKLKLGFHDIKAEVFESAMLDVPNNISERRKVEKLKQLRKEGFQTLKTVHHKFDKTGKIVDSILFDKDDHESEGTKKIVDLSGIIFHILKFGQILIIDELDAKLHPLITMRIVELFNSPESNPNNAQLIFATHDTNLLGESLFRRDQIWFTEKDQFEQTDLYSLYDFNLPDGSKVRNDSNLEKNYMRGRYGAIPFITS